MALLKTVMSLCQYWNDDLNAFILECQNDLTQHIWKKSTVIMSTSTESYWLFNYDNSLNPNCSNSLVDIFGIIICLVLHLN